MKLPFKPLALALAIAASGASTALAQSEPPALPTLAPAQQDQVRQQLDPYRARVQARIERGEINPDEGNRLIRWREWQLAQQAAGLAPPPATATAPSDRVVREYVYPPYPYYPPYAGPYYYPGPVYWGAGICAGGFGHHWGGRICI